MIYKILLAFLLALAMFLLPLIIVSFSAGNILLPGLGLVISGAFLGVLLLLVEAVVLFLAVWLLRRIWNRPPNLR